MNETEALIARVLARDPNDKLARMLREALAHICRMATLRDDYTEEARDEALAEIEKIARES